MFDDVGDSPCEHNPNVANRNNQEAITTKVYHWKDVKHLWDKDNRRFTDQYEGRELVYIGREMPRYELPRSAWNNPYKIDQDGTREEVIAKYRELIEGEDHPLQARLHELIGKGLVCWCGEGKCHGDVLAEKANALAGYAQERIDTPPEWWTKRHASLLRVCAQSANRTIIPSQRIMDDTERCLQLLGAGYFQPVLKRDGKPRKNGAVELSDKGCAALRWPSVQELEAQDQILIRALPDDCKLVIARVGGSEYSPASEAQDGTALIKTLWDNGLLRSINQNAQKATYALSAKGVRIAGLLDDKYRQQAEADRKKALEARRNKGEREKKVVIGQDNMPYAEIIAPTFCAATPQDVKLKSDRTNLNRISRELRTCGLSLSDVQYLCDWVENSRIENADDKSHWIHNATMNWLIDSKGRAARILAERGNDTQKHQQMVGISIADDLLEKYRDEEA